MIGKSIFEYNDYRNFLRDVYLEKKAKDKKFSFRFFSRMAGFKSCGFFKMVMDGQRNITPASIVKFVKVLKLNKEEAEFFKSLVLLNQSTTADQKQKYAEEILRSRSYRKIYPLKLSQYNYFANWHTIVIREMVGLVGFREDYDWLAKKISPGITAAEVKRSVGELIKLGLLKRDERGKLKQTEMHVTTPDEVIAGSVAHYHREMMKRASESIDTVSREKRDIAGMTISVSTEMAQKIKEKVQKFRNEVFEMASHETGPDSVYQLNFHFFPLVSSSEDEK